jgi:superfamily II DNA or RNA helicase
MSKLTDDTLKIYNFLNTIPHDSSEYLLKYQKLVKEYVLKYGKNRGILIMFDPGYGKSITASSIAEEFSKGVDGMKRKIIVLAPKSLHDNFKNAIYQYRSIENNHDKNLNNYTFITSNASNMIKQFSKIDNSVNSDAIDKFVGRFTLASDLDDKVIIVDEAHNLFNSIVNGSKNATKFYDLVMGAKNIKLIFLTGTPIINSPFEIVPCYNMLFGPINSNTNSNKKLRSSELDFRYDTLLPEEYDVFNNYFVKDNKIHNKEKLQARIVGMTTFYGDSIAHKFVGAADDLSPSDNENIKLSDIITPEEKDLKNVEFPNIDNLSPLDNGGKESKFPQLNPLHVIKIKMSKLQYDQYESARQLERAEELRTTKGPRFNTILTRPKSSNVSTYRVKSRQIGDFYTDTFKLKSQLIIEDDPQPQISGEVKESEEVDINVGLSTTNSNFAKVSEQLDIYSPKLNYILKDIEKKQDQLSIIYSAFVKHTLYNTEEVLKVRGYKKFVSNISSKTGVSNINNNRSGNGVNNHRETGSKNKTYAIISGQVLPEERDEIMRIFKSKENAHGKYINLVLLSSAGSEGLDFKNVRNMYIFEPHWNYARIKQLIARIVRYESHMDLSKEERKVDAYLFLAVAPSIDKKQTEEQDTKVLEMETDVSMYSKALENKILIDQFLEMLKETAIDCGLYSDKCFICQPNGKKLFELDFHKDMLTPSNCKNIKEKQQDKVAVEEYLINGEKYYVQRNTKKDIENIYTFDKELNGYVEIEPALYGIIMQKI